MSNAKKTGIESRRTPRRVYKRPVGVLCAGRYSLTQALQLSEGGLGFQSAERFGAPCEAVITLILPGGRCVVARAQIIYEKPAPSSSPGEFLYGVKFSNLPLHLRRIVRNYVTAKTQAEAEQERDDLDDDAQFN